MGLQGVLGMDFRTEISSLTAFRAGNRRQNGRPMQTAGQVPQASAQGKSKQMQNLLHHSTKLSPGKCPSGSTT